MRVDVLEEFAWYAERVTGFYAREDQLALRFARLNRDRNAEMWARLLKRAPRPRPAPKPPPQVRHCAHCGEVLEGQRRDARYCCESHKKLAKYWRKRGGR